MVYLYKKRESITILYENVVYDCQITIKQKIWEGDKGAALL